MVPLLGTRSCQVLMNYMYSVLLMISSFVEVYAYEQPYYHYL